MVSSKLEYEDALDFGIARKKLHIIPMGIDVEGYGEEGGRAENGEPLNILFVGRIARVRRIELLLQAVQRLTVPWSLTLVGGEEKTSSLSKSGYLRELETLCADLGIQDRVTFTGPKPPGELKSFYRSADLFVYPSLYENFAQPVLEAAAEGLPVIATPVGVVPEIVKDGETGFIVSGDPASISARIEQLKEPKVRTEFGKRIREKVRRQFGWDEIMKQYVQLYRSL